MGITSDIEMVLSRAEISVKCDSQISEKCYNIFTMRLDEANRNITRNNMLICKACSSRMRSATSETRAGKYKFDVNALRKIDTVEKAYFMGWIATDGYISRRNEVGIHLKATDAYLIENIFHAVFGLDIPKLKYRKAKTNIINNRQCNTSESANLKISSIELCRDIISHFGLLDDDSKTFNVQMPQFGNDDLAWAFIRGAIEGDGSFTNPKGKAGLSRPSGGKNTIVFASSSEKFKAQFQAFLLKYGIESKCYTDVIHVMGKHAIEVYKYIYPEDVSINQRLERKYIQAQEWLRRSAILDEMEIEYGSRQKAARAFTKGFREGLYQ